MGYLKPHGALYHRVVDDEEQARRCWTGPGRCRCSGCPGGVFVRLAAAAGRAVFLEGFPDRGYTEDGRLVPRDQPGALLADGDTSPGARWRWSHAMDRAVDSVCVHGDAADAVGRATPTPDPGDRGHLWRRFVEPVAR